jgi:hypothetical protein
VSRARRPWWRVALPRVAWILLTVALVLLLGWAAGRATPVPKLEPLPDRTVGAAF